LGAYANGRYRDSVVEFLPETGTFQVRVPGNVEPFSDKARTMLRRRLLKDLDIEADVSTSSVYSDETTTAALGQLLEATLGQNFIDVALSTHTDDGIDAVVFVHSEQKTDDEGLRRTVKGKLTGFLRLYDLSLNAFIITELKHGTPTRPQILRLVYTRAPVSLKEIALALELEGVQAPSSHWLKRQLDSLVRRGVVTWEKPGQYSLTAEGVSKLPARKGRRSPDVSRALELARKRW